MSVLNRYSFQLITMKIVVYMLLGTQKVSSKEHFDDKNENILVENLVSNIFRKKHVKC